MTAPVAPPLWTELTSSPVRWQGTVQITILCMASAALSMALRIPEAAISCYLIFFAWRDDTGSAVLSALLLIIGSALAILLAIPLLRLAVDSAPWRLGLVTGLTFVGMTLAHASRAGPMLGTATFVFAFALTLYDVVPEPDLLSRALAWMWVAVAVPMVLLAAVAIFFGTSPRTRAEELIAKRRAAMADPQTLTARKLLDQSAAQMDGYLSKARLLGHLRGAEAEWLAAEAEASYLDLARAQAGLPPLIGPPPPASEVEKEPLFSPDLLSNPAHTRFGAKVTIAVLITYGFYTIGGLFEIHTAMITCYFVALGTGAETRHKIILRLSGAVMGALLGASVLLLLMPEMNDLGHLMILVAIGAFPAAWISLGSERISYAGWQLALCYFLLILSGFGPVTDPGTARNRVLGIAIGIAVVWAVFTLLWPSSVNNKVDRVLDKFDEDLDAVGGVILTGRTAIKLNASLAEATRLLTYAPFEGTRGEEEARRLIESRARLHHKLRYPQGEFHA